MTSLSPVGREEKDALLFVCRHFVAVADWRFCDYNVASHSFVSRKTGLRVLGAPLGSAARGARGTNDVLPALRRTRHGSDHLGGRQ